LRKWQKKSLPDKQSFFLNSEKDKLNFSEALTMVTAIPFPLDRSLGGGVKRVTFGRLIVTLSSGQVICVEPVVLKSFKSFEKELKLEKGLKGTGFTTVIFS
jgi:hypothetical protein